MPWESDAQNTHHILYLSRGTSCSRELKFSRDIESENEHYVLKHFYHTADGRDEWLFRSTHSSTEAPQRASFKCIEVISWSGLVYLTIRVDSGMDCLAYSKVSSNYR